MKAHSTLLALVTGGLLFCVFVAPGKESSAAHGELRGGVLPGMQMGAVPGGEEGVAGRCAETCPGPGGARGSGACCAAEGQPHPPLEDRRSSAPPADTGRDPRVR